jgi:hypothetical protein
MPLASSSVEQVRFIVESTFGTIPGAGNPRNLRITGETLDFGVSKEASKEINATRTITSMVPTTASASGGITGEISYQEYDTLMAATLQDVWTVFGVNGVGAVFTTTAGGLAVSSITASVATSGASIWTNLQKGQWFRLVAPGDANNDGKILRVSAVTAPTTTVLTLDASTPLVVNAGTVTNCTIATSRLSHGVTQTSYTIERANSDVSQFMAYTGMTPSKMDIKVASGSLSSISLDFMGKSASRAATTQMPGTPVASYTFDIHSGVAGATCQLWEGGTPITGTFVKSVDFSYDNALRSQEAICTLGAVSIGAGTISVSGKLSVYFANGTLFDKFKANTNSSIIFSSIDGAGNGYIFTIPVANIKSWKTNSSAKDQDMMVDVEFVGLRDASNAVAALQKAVFVDRVGIATT